MLRSVDESILQNMIDTQAEFIMEVTDKTKADIKVCLQRSFIKVFADIFYRVEL